MTALTATATVTDSTGATAMASASATITGPTQATVVGGSVLKLAGENMQQACTRLQGVYGDATHKWTPRVFLSSPPTTAQWGTVIPNDRPVVVTWVGDLAAMAAGTLDAQLLAWFNAAPTAYPIFWGLQHEPEDNFTTAAQKAQYIAAWRHVSDLAPNGTNLYPTLILSDWTADAGSGRNWRDWYPGPASIDVLAWDQYNYQNGAGGLNTEANKQLLANRPTAAISHGEGLLYAVGEFGCKFEQTPPIPDATRATWLTQTGAAMKANGAAFVTLFDTNSGGTFNIDDHPTLAAAWRSVVTGA